MTLLGAQDVHLYAEYQLLRDIHCDSRKLEGYSVQKVYYYLKTQDCTLLVCLASGAHTRKERSAAI